jgi:hypothetical protein
VADLDQDLRNCLRHHADDAHPKPTLAGDAKARSRQLTRRAHATVVLALIPATAGATIGSVALADGGSAGRDAAHVTTGRSSEPRCTREKWPNLQKLGLDTQLARKPIGEPTFIRRYSRQHPNIATLSPTRNVIVDDRRLSPWSYAIQIVTKQGDQSWQLMIGAPPHSNHHFHKSNVYNAVQHGCIAVREPAD